MWSEYINRIDAYAFLYTCVKACFIGIILSLWNPWIGLLPIFIPIGYLSLVIYHVRKNNIQAMKFKTKHDTFLTHMGSL